MESLGLQINNPIVIIGPFTQIQKFRIQMFVCDPSTQMKTGLVSSFKLGTNSCDALLVMSIKNGLDLF